MFERFTDRARMVMALANSEAHRFNHDYIGAEHVLLGICKPDGAQSPHIAALILKSLGVETQSIAIEAEKYFKHGTERPATNEKFQLAPRADKVIELAISSARDWQYNYVGTENLLMGLMCEPHGIASAVLRWFGLTPEKIRNAAQAIVRESYAKEKSDPPNPNARFFLDVMTALERTLPGDVLVSGEVVSRIWKLAGEMQQVYRGMSKATKPVASLTPAKLATLKARFDVKSWDGTAEADKQAETGVTLEPIDYGGNATETPGGLPLTFEQRVAREARLNATEGQAQ